MRCRGRSRLRQGPQFVGSRHDKSRKCAYHHPYVHKIMYDGKKIPSFVYTCNAWSLSTESNLKLNLNPPCSHRPSPLPASDICVHLKGRGFRHPAHVKPAAESQTRTRLVWGSLGAVPLFLEEHFAQSMLLFPSTFSDRFGCLGIWSLGA